MELSFQRKVHGKWILAGEHAVLRGVTALVFPIQEAYLEISYQQTKEPLSLQLSGRYGTELDLLFWGVLEKSFQILGLQKDEMHLKGVVRIRSEIPIGAGLGASGALCVAMSSWLSSLGYMKDSELYFFAKKLEDIFHGESSGVDVAVALSGQGLKFSRQQENQKTEIQPLWRPQLMVSFSGKRGVTKDCVQKVKDFIAKDTQLGLALDQQMRQASELGERSLLQPGLDLKTREQLLIQAMDMGNDCFEQWGLNSEAPKKHMQWLRQLGALSVKPTGSGDGGFILSYWGETGLQKLTDQGVRSEFLSCF